MEEIVKAITQVANHKKVIDHLEKNVFSHEDIKEWQTRRILYAFLLLNEELKKK